MLSTQATQEKKSIEDRLRALKAALNDAERLNKALRVGRTPATVVAVLRALDEARLYEHFTVVGTHALYAYEAAAGVRIKQAHWRRWTMICCGVHASGCAS